VHVLLVWALAFQMIPPVALAGGWFAMARVVGLDNTLVGLILAHATLNLPMALWMMGVFVRDVPQELVEAARLDGATTPVLLRRVVLPLVAPGLAAAGVLCFVFSWNEFAAALNLSMRQTATVPVAIAKFAQDYEIRYVQMAAAASLSAIPALLLLLVAQRWIVKGLTLGAVK
jgi:multiple sugar transport system permease protein